MIIKFLDKTGFRYLEKKCFENHEKVSEKLYKLCVEFRAVICPELQRIVKDYIESEGSLYNVCIVPMGYFYLRKAK